MCLKKANWKSVVQTFFAIEKVETKNINYMCFSATASFITGGVLSAVGVVTIKKAEKKSEIPFASIPLLFGIQQMAILTPSLASLVTKESGNNYGTALGIFSSVNSLGQVLGVVIGSVMMIRFVHLPYFIISILLLLTACIAVPKFRLKILHLKNIGKIYRRKIG